MESVGASRLIQLLQLFQSCSGTIRRADSGWVTRMKEGSKRIGLGRTEVLAECRHVAIPLLHLTDDLIARKTGGHVAKLRTSFSAQSIQ